MRLNGITESERKQEVNSTTAGAPGAKVLDTHRRIRSRDTARRARSARSAPRSAPSSSSAPANASPGGIVREGFESDECEAWWVIRWVTW